MKIRNFLLCNILLISFSLTTSSFATPKMLEEPGPYKVGYRQVSVIDASRSTGINASTGGHPLEVSIWYPIDNSVASGGIPVVYDASAVSLLNYGIPALHIAHRPTLDVRVAPSSVLPLSLSGPNNPACADIFGTACASSTIVGLPVSNAGSFPVLLFSHGIAANPKFFSRIEEHLASYGFIVVAPRHTGNSNVDAGVYAITGLTCSMLPFYPCADEGNTPILNRPQDLSFVLNKLLDGSFGADLMAAANSNKVGVVGQSLGGTTALLLAGGLASPTGSFPAGGLADPRIRAVVAISALKGTFNAVSGATPTLQIPDPNVEAIHVPTMIMYGDHEVNDNGINIIQQSDEFFNRLDTNKTAITYRVILSNAVHQSFTNICEQGFLDTIALGNGNASGLDAFLMSGFFLYDGRSPNFPPSLAGKTDYGFQAICRNDFFYSPANLALWTTLGLNGLLLNAPPYSIPLANLPGYIDPDTFTFIPLRNSDEVQKETSGYLVAFFNIILKDDSQSKTYFLANPSSKVTICRQTGPHKTCTNH